MILLQQTKQRRERPLPCLQCKQNVFQDCQAVKKIGDLKSTGQSQPRSA